MIEKSTPLTTKLIVKDDVPFESIVRIQGETMSKTQYMNLNIRVCGTEVLALANPSKRTFVVGEEAGDPS